MWELKIHCFIDVSFSFFYLHIIRKLHGAKIIFFFMGFKNKLFSM